MSGMTLGEMVAVVADLRAIVARKTAALNESRQAWEDAHAQEIEVHKAMTQALAEAEAALRAAAVAAYQETGNKAPASGVGIRVQTKLAYHPDDALRWAKEHDMALALDKPAFEKIAKAAPPDFVRKVESAQATIATDLSAVVEEAVLS